MKFLSESLKSIRKLTLNPDAMEDKLKNVDVIIDKLQNKVFNKNVSDYSELLRSYISKNTLNTISSNKNDNNVIDNILNSNSFYDIENRSRLIRYMNADEIADNIPYASSALEIIADEITSPDNITKESIQIMENDSGQEISKTEIDYVRQIREELNIESLIHGIINHTLKFGDQFVEICDFKDKEIPLTQTFLTEDSTISKPVEIKYVWNNQEKQFNVSLDFTVDVNEGSYDLKKERNLGEIAKYKLSEAEQQSSNINDIGLVIHDPAYVIKIQSRRYKMCLGYIVLPNYGENSDSVLKRYNFNSCGNNYPVSSSTGLPTYSGVGVQPEVYGIDGLYIQLIDILKKHLDTKDVKIDSKEVKEMLKRVISEVDLNKNNNIPIRFVPISRMQHFSINNLRFFPYGESIFYKSFFAAKLLILQEVAVSMRRVIDSQEKRVMYVETGMQRNAGNLIENLKQNLKKRKISIDTFGSISSIPSTITAYEDIIIPQIKGTRFVEFDTISPVQNSRDATEELKFFRDILVASLRVPPSYIGLEENTTNKANLSQQSQIFARIIISYQKSFSKNIRELFNKIHVMTKKVEIPKKINITLPPPKVIQTELQAEHLRTAGEVIDILVNLGADKEIVKKKYLNVDWDEMEISKTKTKLTNKAKPDAEQEDNVTPSPYSTNSPSYNSTGIQYGKY